MHKSARRINDQYLKRTTEFKKYGYDIKMERELTIKKARPIHGNILEVGTGQGNFTLALAKAGFRFTSVDISKKAVRDVCENIKYYGLGKLVKFKIENAEKLSFKENSFDVIFSINTVHHFKNPFKVMNELIRTLSFKGKIILSDFTKKGFDVLAKIHKKDGREHPVGEVGLKNIVAYLKKQGFKVKTEKGILEKMIIAKR